MAEGARQQSLVPHPRCDSSRRTQMWPVTWPVAMVLDQALMEGAQRPLTSCGVISRSSCLRVATMFSLYGDASMSGYMLLTVSSLVLRFRWANRCSIGFSHGLYGALKRTYTCILRAVSSTLECE